MTKIIRRGYLTELDPNQAQRLLFTRHAGAARFAYNWGLERLRAACDTRVRPPSFFDLQKELNRLKKGELAWMYELSKCPPQEALRDLDRAYKTFLRDRVKLRRRARAKGRETRKDGMPLGFPRFKRKKERGWAFRISGSNIRVFNDAIQLPRIGRIRFKERNYFPTEDVHIFSATVSERAGRWFVSLRVKTEIDVSTNHGPVVGIDLGISHLITVGDGTLFENPRALPTYGRKLRRLQRLASRKNPFSKKRSKVNLRIAKCHLRISNIRKDAIHKATTTLARNKSVVGVETLNVVGMMANHRLASALADASFREILRQLKYKMDWFGGILAPAKEDFPSSRRCSQCDWIGPKLPLSERLFRCGHCGLEMDRDLNAAKNNEFVALSCRETVNARKRREVTAPGVIASGAVPDNETGTEGSRLIPLRTTVLEHCVLNRKFPPLS